MEAKELFKLIVKKECKREHVELGKMMSAPGIRYKNKVYAFLWDDKIGFKLGKGFDIEGTSVSKWEYLNPFKNKAPMKAWYIIGIEHADLWEEFTELAYQFIYNEVEG